MSNQANPMTDHKTNAARDAEALAAKAWWMGRRSAEIDRTANPRINLRNIPSG